MYFIDEEIASLKQSQDKVRILPSDIKIKLNEF